MMKKITALLASFVLLPSVMGCQKESVSAGASSPTESAASSTGAEPLEPAPTGTTETFTYDQLVLEVSNVCEIRTDTGIYDNGDPYEYPVYVCYPGAMLTIVNAGMSDPAYAEDHLAHPEWGLYDFVLSKIAQLDTLKLFVLTPFTDVIEVVAIAYAITGFLVGVFGSLLSIRKFLKV